MRLNELDSVVDFFVLVEARHTFTGNSKPLYFNENKHLFEQFLHKIVHIIVEDMPNNGNAWDNEFHQINCIARAYSHIQLNDEDLIIISDCDEIPDSETLGEYKKSGLSHSVGLEQDLYYYNLECKGNNALFLARTSNPQGIRNGKLSSGIVNKKGGWHFSYFGDIDFIKNKIKNFAHQELNNETYLNDEKIKRQIENFDDLYFRENSITHGFKKVAIKDNPYLPQNIHLL